VFIPLSLHIGNQSIMDASKRDSDNILSDIMHDNAGSPGKGLLIPYYAVEAARIGTWEPHLASNAITVSSVLAGILGLPERQSCLSPTQWETLIFRINYRPIRSACAIGLPRHWRDHRVHPAWGKKTLFSLVGGRCRPLLPESAFFCNLRFSLFWHG
jgi:hypothetical protein